MAKEEREALLFVESFMGSSPRCCSCEILYGFIRRAFIHILFILFLSKLPAFLFHHCGFFKAQSTCDAHLSDMGNIF